MNTLVILPLILCIVQANAVDKQEIKTKPTSSPVNTIQQSPKYEMIYQPVKFQQPLQQIQLQPYQQLQTLQHLSQIQPQQKPQYVPIQLIPKQYYVSQPQPQAMIIIAQPALLPQSLVYGNPTQQLLNYFHSNPQAKYQLLHGNYQQQRQRSHAQPQQAQQIQPTATYMHPVLATPGYGNYILTAAPQVTTQPLVAHTSPVPVQYATQQPQLQHHQLQVQRIQPQQQHVQTQQQQIQSQQQHIQPQQQQIQHQQQQIQIQQQQVQPQQHQTTQLSSLAQLAQLAAQQYVATQMGTAPAIVTGFEHFTPEQQAQIKTQLSAHLGTNFHAVANAAPNQQYSAKYAAEQEKNFVPSPQINTEMETKVEAQSGDILKIQYVNKGKN